MKKFPALLFVFLFAALPAHARDQIRIVGSSTLYPLITIAAENFGREGKFHTPVVESTGSGGGIKLFCEGVGDNFPDIVNASRKIKLSEIARCRKNGVTDIEEIKIGYDGIVLADSISGPKYKLTKSQVFLALARQVPVNGKLAENPYQYWNEIDPHLPKEKIIIYGPPPTDGTRDAFSDEVMVEACMNMPEFKTAYPDAEQRNIPCKLIREDGKYVEIGSNYNLVIQKLLNQPAALGIFGYNYLMENGGKVQGSAINGTAPDFATIAGGKYPVSRALYVYVKLQNVKTTAGIREFLMELVSDKAIGPEGYLVEKGLVPLKEKEFLEMRKIVAELKKSSF